MKRVWKMFFVLASVALLSGASAWGAEEGWLVDFKAAKEKAAKEGKELFMEFTGSDWCPPCINFKKKVLDSDVFKTAAPESYILLKLDNPRDKSKQSPEEIEQYKQLSAEYKITGVPTVILADPAGKPFAKMVGYGGQEPDVYVKDLVEKKGLRKTRDEALAKAEKAEGVEKAKLLNEAISGIDAELTISLYRDVIDQIIKLDGENAAGLKTKYEGAVRAADLRGALQEITKGIKPNEPTTLAEAAAKIDEMIGEKKPEGEALQEALFLKAQLLFRADKAKSKEALLAAQKAAPESRIGAQIDQILKQAFADDEKKEEKKDEEKKEEKK